MQDAISMLNELADLTKEEGLIGMELSLVHNERARFHELLGDERSLRMALSQAKERLRSSNVSGPRDRISCLKIVLRAVSGWHVFAMQVMLDIHRILRGKVSQPMQDLLRFTGATTRQLKMVRHWIPTTTTKNRAWGPEDDKALGSTLEILSDSESDTIGEVKRRAVRAGVQTEEPFFLMKRHPMFLHIYQACIDKHLIKERWKSRETVMRIQGTNAFIVGEAQTGTSQEYIRRFTLSCKGSLANFARGSRTGVMQTASAKRGVSAKGELGMLFTRRLREGAFRLGLTSNDI
ncbi:Uu.00g067280.m01.CDS01 [Anthostomella pinea]|uniref:Uu.00g067280.m01.CDS01 n=1 Tax=Anthostomella pinea TaxID=933095 RepID=A0AAI8YNC0_9PEZI|nr:Uu.00g067280.m01.CDS01 [Anthostomella pinea]